MCKSTLRSLGKHSDIKGLVNLFEEHLVLDQILDFRKFIDGFCALMVNYIIYF